MACRLDTGLDIHACDGGSDDGDENGGGGRSIECCMLI